MWQHAACSVTLLAVVEIPDGHLMQFSTAVTMPETMEVFTLVVIITKTKWDASSSLVLYLMSDDLVLSSMSCICCKLYNAFHSIMLKQ